MKKTIFFICMVLVLIGKDYYAQNRRGGDPAFAGPKKRIEELEKLKLLEVLDLNEKTMLQFFSRRKEFNDNLQKLENERNDKLNTIQDMIYDKTGDKDYKKVISDILNIDERINKTKEEYIISLDGMLTNEQIAKLFLFERNFKMEIKEIILKHRRNK